MEPNFIVPNKSIKIMGQIAIRKVIAQRLENARIAAGYDSPEYFCQKHNLDLNLYLKHEKANAALRASLAMRYSDLLNVSLQWLMLGDDWDKLA